MQARGLSTFGRQLNRHSPATGRRPAIVQAGGTPALPGADSERAVEVLALKLQVSDTADAAPHGLVGKVRGDGDRSRELLDVDGRLDVRPVAAVPVPKDTATLSGSLKRPD